MNSRLTNNKNVLFQLNPFHDNMYEVLKEIFQEYLEIFDYDTFHTGGDEVFNAS